MANINLIPGDYVTERSNRRVIKRAASCCIAILGVAALLAVSIQARIRNEEINMAALSAFENPAVLQKRIQDLMSRKVALEKDAALMEKVQANPDIAAIIRALEITLESDVWVKELRYTRHQEPLDSVSCAAFEHSGGLPIRVDGVVPGQPGQCWKQERALDLKAAATRHQAAGAFLQALARQPRFDHVRFVNSTASTTEQGHIVEFAVHARMGTLQRVLTQ